MPVESRGLNMVSRPISQETGGGSSDQTVHARKIVRYGALVLAITATPDKFTPAVPPALANMQRARDSRVNPHDGIITVTEAERTETVYSD